LGERARVRGLAESELRNQKRMPIQRVSNF